MSFKVSNSAVLFWGCLWWVWSFSPFCFRGCQNFLIPCNAFGVCINKFGFNLKCFFAFCNIFVILNGIYIKKHLQLCHCFCMHSETINLPWWDIYSFFPLFYFHEISNNIKKWFRLNPGFFLLVDYTQQRQPYFNNKKRYINSSHT